MPSDTFSNGLGYLVMATGNDNNTWGVNANGSVFQIFEDSISGQLTVNTTGGTTDLSGSPPPAGPRADRYSQIIVTGILASNATIKVCQITKNWQVLNLTTGGFDVIMQTSNGSAVPITIPNGKLINVSCISATQLARSDHTNVGEWVSFGAVPGTAFAAGPVQGGGLLRADGSAVSRTGKVDLFHVYGTTYGVGDGSTTFNLPTVTDTGRYLRSYIPGTTTVGTTQANLAAGHTHSFSATSGGESALHTHTYSGTTGGESAVHQHTLTSAVSGGSGIQAGGGYSYTTITTSNENTPHNHAYSGTSATESVGHNHSVSGTTGSAGGTETRPETMIVWMGVRY